MASAAILASLLKMGLATSLCVMFGWQPMPDGSPRLEYLVQIEPALAATLKEGQSIPIVSDIPDDLGPIGRIRIIVGTDDLPRQRLLTHFKPWPQQLSREGLVETQLTVPPVQPSGDRYAAEVTAANEILPPSSDAGAAANPFGRALQQGAQEARELATNVKDKILPPTGNQLFGDSGFSDQNVRSAIDDTADRLQRGMQQGVDQVGDRVGQGVDQTLNNLGQRAGNAVDRFGRSLAPEQTPLNNGQERSSATILPPDNQANRRQRIDQEIQQPPKQQPQRQREAPPQSTPPANFAESSIVDRNRSSAFDAQWPPRSQAPSAESSGSNPAPSNYGDGYSNELNNQRSQPPAASSQWPSEQENQRNGRDAFDLANRRNENPPPRYANNDRPQLISPSGDTQPAIESPVGKGWPSNSPTPEIRREMLEQPVSGDYATGGTAPNYQEQATARPPFNSQEAGAQSANPSPMAIQPRDFGSGNQNYANNDPNSTNGKTLFPLLLSWVLLSGSGAGNLYLFWSYLDVRNKYHGIVHGRPSRRDRYEE